MKREYCRDNGVMIIMRIKHNPDESIDGESQYESPIPYIWVIVFAFYINIIKNHQGLDYWEWLRI